MLNRRTLLAIPLALGMGGAALAQSEVKVGLIAPMSGPWARQGDLMLKGANLAIEHINAQGGIKALNGARMKLITFDAGDSVEKAKNAAQRMVAQEPDLVGATGAWLSSFTLGVTEVTERAELPVLTLSYSDQITARGFKFVFQTSLGGGAQAVSAMPAILKLAEAATGKKPRPSASSRTTPRPRSASPSRCARAGSRSSASSWWWTRPSRRRCRTARR